MIEVRNGFNQEVEVTIQLWRDIASSNKMFDRYNLENIVRAINSPELLRDEFSRQIRPIREFGWYGVPLIASEIAHRYLISGEEQTSVWDKEWDVLIVLDACRAEWLSTVASEFEFITEVDSIYSVGGHSAEWIDRTFDDQYSQSIKDCAYVTANHHSKWMEPDKFAHFEDVTNYETDEETLPAPPAHVVTDQAIHVARTKDWNQMIVHYMQPHKPFLNRGDGRRDVSLAAEWSTGYEMYRKVIKGDLTRSELERGFIDNLRYVLDEVELLIENIDAPTVAITSDHGNALGERFLWDHRRGVNHPSVRRVPWAECSAEDKRTVEPAQYRVSEETQEEVKQRLKQLGYR